MKIHLKLCAKRLLFVLLSMVVAIGAYVLYQVERDNFHVVSGGKVYRSSQMSSGALARVIRERGIKSILNLRGGSPKNAWYCAETNTSHRLGVEHFSFALSARREVKDEQIERILATIRRAPKPMLIHCRAGADRTGLIAGLYLYSLEAKSARSAHRELSILYGHVPHFFWRDTIAMDRSFWRYINSHAPEPNAMPVHAQNP